jgi:hypothetical protein
MLMAAILGFAGEDFEDWELWVKLDFAELDLSLGFRWDSWSEGSVGWTDWDLADRLAFMRSSASDMVLGFLDLKYLFIIGGGFLMLGCGGVYFK